MNLQMNLKQRKLFELSCGQFNKRDVYDPKNPSDLQREIIRLVSKNYKPSMGTMRRRLRVAAAEV